MMFVAIENASPAALAFISKSIEFQDCAPSFNSIVSDMLGRIELVGSSNVLMERFRKDAYENYGVSITHEIVEGMVVSHVGTVVAPGTLFSYTCERPKLLDYISLVSDFILYAHTGRFACEI